MLTINLDPVLVHLGSLALSWYGLAVAAGIAAGVGITIREAARRDLPPGPIFDVAAWAVVGGFIGGRLLHVVDRWPEYAANPGAILAVQNGGLAILGAVLGGTLTGAFGAWRAGLPVRCLSDAAAPGVVLGQAIGRLGCLVTGDALGPATDGTWGIVYTHPGSSAPILGVAYQPTFAYEMAWDLAVFSVLWVVRERLRGDGYLFGLYLALYGFGKFVLTFLRTETVWLVGLQEAQLLAVATMAVAAAWAFWRPSTRFAGRRP